MCWVIHPKHGEMQLGLVMIRTSSDLMLEEVVLMKHGEIEWGMKKIDTNKIINNMNRSPLLFPSSNKMSASSHVIYLSPPIGSL